MYEQLQQILVYTSLPEAALILGGVFASFRSPGPSLRSSIQHFAAGVVFAAVAVELLPDVLDKHEPRQVLIGFALGVALMIGVKWLTQKVNQTEKDNAELPAGLVTAVAVDNTELPADLTGAVAVDNAELPMSLIITVAVDLLTDGLLLGIGFAAGAKEGFLLTLALTIEILFLGLSTSSALRKVGVSRDRTMITTVGLAVLLALGATAGALLLGGLSNSNLEVLLSFGCAALLYLVTEELLVEAHEEPETPLTSSTFFAGFLLVLMLRMSG